MEYNIRKPEIWFFKTVEDRSDTGVPRLRLLPSQFIPSESGDGTFIMGDPELNTESDLKPRQVHPVGTIFAAKFAQMKRSAKGTPFYSVMRTKTEKNNLISMIGGVSADIQDAYEEYLKQSSAVEADAKALASEPVKTTGGIPLIDQLIKDNPCPSVDKDNFYVDRDVWTALLFNVHQGYNTMLVGDSGTGKTELAILMGKMLGKPVKVFDMAAKQDPIASLIGVHRFEDGKSIFDRADFTFALEADNIVVLDELPRAPMNTNNILFPVLDSRRELSMDVAHSGARAIKLNSGCKFIATANEGYEYTGNNVLDKALKERFQIIPVDFMPEKEEIELLSFRTGAGKATATVITKAGRQIRDMRKRDEISASVSIRHTLYAADLASAGMPVSKAMEIAYLPLFIIDDEKKKVRDLLASR